MRWFPPRWLVVLLCTLPAAAQAQSLLEFYRHALDNNPGLRARVFGVEQARAQQELATSRLLPQVSISGSYYRNDYREEGLPGRRYDGVRASLQARQALLDLASYFRLQGARYLVAQSEQNQEATRVSLASEIVDRYLTALQTADEIQRIHAEKETIERQLKRLRVMRERELVKVTDLYETEAYYQGLNTREIEAGNARAVAFERLREATGLSVQRIAPLARENFAPVSGQEETWVGEAVQANASLAALQHGIEAARKTIESSRAEHMPQVSLTATQTYSDQGYDNRLVPSYNVGTIGLQVTVPIYEGGRVQATIRDATARYEVAREQHEGARREIERDTRTAFLSAQANHARIASTGEEVRALEKVLDAQQKSYERGVATIIDVLTAQQRLFKSRSDRSKASYDYVRDLTRLRVNAGRMTHKDVEEIDRMLAGAN